MLILRTRLFARSLFLYYFCTVKQKLDIQLLAAFVLSIGGLILLFCGVFIDPQGQIHESLLVAFGEIATFAGSIIGIDYKYKTKHDHRNTHPPEH